MVTSSDGSLSLAFTAATSSQPILDYQYSLDGGMTWTLGGTTTAPLVNNGVINATTYSVELRAVNSVDDGPASASSSRVGIIFSSFDQNVAHAPRAQVTT